ncbi:MAG: helix-turn-helix transcriptional regulator [Legionellales bacterium]
MMGHYLKTNNISTELLFSRHGSGVKLTNPHQLQNSQNDNSGLLPFFTVQDVLNLPVNVYFCNASSAILQINEYCAEECGFDSVTQSTGKSAYDAFSKKMAENVIAHDQLVLKTDKIYIFEETGTLQQGPSFQGLSIKSPCYNHNNETIGFFGITIVHGKHNLVAALKQISLLGLLTPNHYLSKSNQPFTLDAILQLSMDELNEILTKRSYPIKNELKQTTLSRMEIKTLIQLIKGMHAGEIAATLHIKQTTVESYLIHVKNKLGVNTKSELIQFISKNQLLNQIFVSF